MPMKGNASVFAISLLFEVVLGVAMGAATEIVVAVVVLINSGVSFGFPDMLMRQTVHAVALTQWFRRFHLGRQICLLPR